jgi:hypothetical protein
MATISVISSPILEVVGALREYLEKIVPSDFASLAIDEQKSHKWEVLGTIFVDFVPVSVQICATSSTEEISIAVHQISRNDTVRFNTMFKQMVGFLQARGFQAMSNFSVSSLQARLLDDDDFGFSDDEEPTWDEKVQPVLGDTGSCRTEVRAEAFRALAEWASSSPDSHEALANGLLERAAELSTIFSTSSQASVAETYPFAVAVRKVSEGCSSATRENLLKSKLSTMMEPALKPKVPAVVAHEYQMAMQALGLSNVSEPLKDFTVGSKAISDISGKTEQIQKSMQFDNSKISFESYVSSEVLPRSVF